MAGRDRVRQGAVLAAAAAQIAGAALHPLGLAPYSVGGRTEPVTTPVVPADYAFSIWGVIFLTGALFAAWQALPRNDDDALLRRLGWPVAATFGGNALWETLAQYGVGDAPLAVLLGLIVVAALTALHALVAWPEPAHARRWWLVDLPVGLTAGWVSAALFANASTALQSAVRGATDQPAHDFVWVGLIGGAALFAALQLLRARGQLAYAIGVIWALLAVAAANARDENGPALICAALGLLVVLAAVWRGRWSRARSVAARAGE